MTKNKVIHARIDDDIHDRLFEKCNELGCSFTDYIESVIESSLEDEEPNIEPETRYIALCRICWGYYEEEDLKKAISKIRHYKKCPYDKDDLERCIEVISPKNPITD